MSQSVWHHGLIAFQRHFRMKIPVNVESPAPEPENPGLPLLRSWTAVYLFVLGSFALWVALLIALTKMFS
jgi:hypothetical protein